MAKKLATFDPTEHLHTDQAIADFMGAAFETNDPAYVAHALGVVARAKGMTQIANKKELMRDRAHDDAMAEALRNDPAYAAALLNSIIESGDQGELLIALRHLRMAFSGEPSAAKTRE